eukprot:gene4700-6600_t
MFGHTNNVHKPSFKKSGEVVNRTQRAALQLQANEENTTKKKRLEDLLLHQFIAKYGSKNKSSEVNRYILSAVKKFVNDYDSISEAEKAINLFEQEVKQGVEKMKIELKAKKNVELEESYQYGNNNNDYEPQSSYSNNADSRTANVQNQWPLINAIMAAESEKLNQQKIEESTARKMKFQNELSKQIADQKKRNYIEQIEKQKMLETMKSSLHNYEDEQKKTQQLKEEHFKRERELRLQQIEERKILREKEKQMKVAQEQVEMAISKRLAMEEEDAKKQKKENEKRRQELLFEENERNKTLKAAQLKERQDYEKKLNREYEEKLEREEKARTEAFQARVDALASISKNYENRVGARLEQEAKAETKKVMSQIEEKDRSDYEKEKLKQEKRQLEMMRATEFNISLIEKKRREKEQERLDAFDRRQRMEQEALDFKRKEKEAITQKKIMMLENKKLLDVQIAQRNQANSNFVALSDIEVKLNQSIIKKLNEDPKIREKVMEMVSPEPVKFHTKKGSQIF